MLNIKPKDFLVTKTSENVDSDVQTFWFFGNYLYIGKNLRCVSQCINDQGHGICIIGYCIDCMHPGRTEAEIANELLNHGGSVENIYKETCYLGGRWVILYFEHGKTYVVPDCCALMQSFYCLEPDSVVSSDSEIIAYLKNSQIDQNAKGYYEKEVRVDAEYSMPFDSTLYSNVKRVLPNHVLNVTDCLISRMPTNTCIGPSKKGDIIFIKQAVENLLVGLSARFDELAFSLTAGLDSRFVSSFIPKLMGKKHNNLFTFTHSSDNEPNIEVLVAREISKKLGVEHKTIKYQCSGSNHENINHKHSFWDAVDSSIYQNLSSHAVVIKGSGSEIIRLPYGRFLRKIPSVEVACKCMGVVCDNYSKTIVKDWIKYTQRNYNKRITIYDLIYWEHRMGSWQAQGQYESNDYFEVFTPFNCRVVLELFFNQNYKNRIPPYHLYKRIINENIDLSDVPINYEKEGIISLIKRNLKYVFPLFNQLYWEKK